MKKNAVVNGTHLGLNGIIICSDNKITFLYKSTDREVLKRWYYKDMGNIYVDVNDNQAVIEFYQFGKRILFTDLSPKGLDKIKKFIDTSKEV